jgi:hypothetical protein
MAGNPLAWNVRTLSQEKRRNLVQTLRAVHWNQPGREPLQACQRGGRVDGNILRAVSELPPAATRNENHRVTDVPLDSLSGRKDCV